MAEKTINVVALISGEDGQVISAVEACVAVLNNSKVRYAIDQEKASSDEFTISSDPRRRGEHRA